MGINIFNYIDKSEYDVVCGRLRNKETKVIYNDSNLNIEVKKVGKRIFTFVNTYGDKKLNEALNNICSLV